MIKTDGTKRKCEKCGSTSFNVYEYKDGFYVVCRNCQDKGTNKHQMANLIESDVSCLE